MSVLSQEPRNEEIQHEHVPQSSRTQRLSSSEHGPSQRSGSSTRRAHIRTSISASEEPDQADATLALGYGPGSPTALEEPEQADVKHDHKSSHRTRSTIRRIRSLCSMNVLSDDPRHADIEHVHVAQESRTQILRPSKNGSSPRTVIPTRRITIRNTNH